MVFPVVTYRCESWTVNKVDCQRTSAFKLWCWRRFLKVPWIAWRSSQLILREIHPEYSLEGLMLKLKLQYFGHLMWRADSLEKTLMLGKIESRKREPQWMRWLDGLTNTMHMNLGKLQEILRDREAWHTAVLGVAKSRLTDQHAAYGILVSSPGIELTPLAVQEPSLNYWTTREDPRWNRIRLQGSSEGFDLVTELICLFQRSSSLPGHGLPQYPCTARSLVGTACGNHGPSINVVLDFRILLVFFLHKMCARYS